MPGTEGQTTVTPGPDLAHLAVPPGQTGLKEVCLDLEPRVSAGLTFAHLSPRAMFCNDLKEKYEKRIVIKGVDAETMHTLLDYTYTSKALITKQNVQRVLEAANLFQVCEQTGPVLSSGEKKASLLWRSARPGAQACTWDTHSWACAHLKCPKGW